MGKKRKNKDPGNKVKQLHPQQSFQQMTADAALARVRGYIDAQMQGVGQALIQRQAQAQQSVFMRIIALEELLMEKFEGLTKDDLANRVADIQDKSEGFDLVEGAVETGDRVRLEIQVKTEDQKEYQEASKFIVDNVGSNEVLGKELESAIIGMTAGETKEVLFGKDHSMGAILNVNKVSRKPKPEIKEETKATSETETTSETKETKEVSDVDSNAG